MTKTSLKKNKNEIDESMIEKEAYELLKSFSYVRDYNHPDEFYVKFPCDFALGAKIIQSECVDNTKSKDFKAFVNMSLRETLEIDDIPSLYKVYNRIYDEIRYNGTYETIYNRIAGTADEIIYFLADQTNRCISITADKVKSIRQSNYFFYKKKNMLPQDFPKKTSKSLYELLRPYINLDENNYKLFLVYLCHLFIYDTSHMICIINSTHGSGKSTLTKLIRRLVDPALSENALIPSSKDELINHCANNYIVCFDNTRPLNTYESDTLCAAVTGSVLPKRTLYTTCAEDTLFLKNIIILNGIDIIPKHADFTERSLMFELQPIKEQDRITETEFWNNFNSDKPEILYAIFQTLKKMLNIKKTLDLNGKSHRMHDAFTYMCSIAVALGMDLAEFQEIFFNNTNTLQKLSSGNDEFVNAVASYVDSLPGHKITNTTTYIYNQVRSRDNLDKFPASASAFSRKLNENLDVIEKLGFDVITESKKDATYLTLKKKPKKTVWKNKKNIL